MSENSQVSLNAPNNEEPGQTPEQPPEEAQVKHTDIDPAHSLREGPVTAQELDELEYEEIGPLLRDLRGPLSLRQMEEATGITYSYLSNIERGNRRPGIKPYRRWLPTTRFP